MGLEVIALGLLAAGTAASINEQRKAGKQQRRALDAERRKAEIENVRSIRQQVRAARIAQSSIINQSALGGTMGSSGMQGGVASVGSQLGGNLSYMSDVATENTTIFNATQAAARASSNAAIYGQLGQLGSTIFSSQYGGKKAE